MSADHSLPPPAFVLAAGLGTRLAPLTDILPKPLIPVFHKPLVTFALDALLAAGVGALSLNTHHLPSAFPSVLGESPSYRGRPVSIFHEPLLLDTGGGISNARAALGGGSFLVHNGDILADLPLADLIALHSSSGNLATLLLRPEGSGGKANVRFEPGSGRVLDLRGGIDPDGGVAVIYTGIAMISHGIFEWIPGQGPFSVVDALLGAMKAGHRVGGLLAHDGLWMDLGTPAAYLEAHRLLADPSRRPAYLEGEWPVPIHPEATVFPGATFEGMVAVGPGAVIGKNALVRDSVIWPGAILGAEAVIEGCIVSGRVPVGGHHRGEVL